MRPTSAAGPIRVGVYDNPPLVSAVGGLVRGLAIDVLEVTARREGWELSYRECEFATCLAWLEAGQLDLLVAIGFSEDRAARLRFGEESLISNYGVVYGTEAAGIRSMLDLEGRRVALLEGNLHGEAFRSLMRSFDLPWAEVPRSDFAAVLSAVRAGEADAGIVNRLYSLDNPDVQGLVPTGIVFNPIEIRYAAPWVGRHELLNAIDADIRRLKATEGSLYYRAIGAWTGTAAAGPLPAWLPWAGAGLAALLGLVLFANLGLRRLVRHRTEELEMRTAELEGEVRRRQKAQDDLARIAFRDTLTGLPTRFVLRDRLQQAIRGATVRDSRVGVLMVDLDRFRSVNQMVGQTVADELFERIAERITMALPATATLGRLEGDEFLIVLPSLGEAARLTEIGQRLLEVVRTPHKVHDRALVITASVGGTVFPEDGVEVDELLARADAAMSDVKLHGRDAYRRFSPEMAPQLLERQRVELSVRRALADGVLTVHFQPIVSLDTGRLEAAEALIRIPGNNGDMLYPERFIPIAEEAGLINRLGRLALEVSASAARQWIEVAPDGPRMAINVSPHQFEDADFLEQLDAAIGPTGFPLSRLELELTEGVYLESLPGRQELLGGLEDRRVQLSIDDFGTGYSSLGYLKRLPVGSVKIDQSFVQDAPVDGRAAEIVKAVVHLARGLGMRCVAEGIETREQLEFLRDIGCPAGQGFLLSRPLPVDDFSSWLADDLPGAMARLAGA